MISAFAIASRGCPSSARKPSQGHSATPNAGIVPRASLALHRDHDAARHCMPLGDQRPIAGIVVPILDRLLARKFDNDDAARPLPF